LSVLAESRECSDAIAVARVVWGRGAYAVPYTLKKVDGVAPGPELVGWQMRQLLDGAVLEKPDSGLLGYVL